MLVSTKMITGFNTDVPHEGLVYHVQTEDRRTDDPAFESLVYVGGSIVAKKLTPYSDKLSEGATEETIASLLKRQHQVIIAAIKAGRIEELIQHTLRRRREAQKPESVALPPVPVDASIESPKRVSTSIPVTTVAPEVVAPPASVQSSERSSERSSEPFGGTPGSGRFKNAIPTVPTSSDSGVLNFDQVISDYKQRGEAKLEVRVLAPEAFIAGTSIALRVQVTHNTKPEFDAIVTVKIIGTAFKPQVVIGRVGRDGVASFSLVVPAFSSGTAAIVIEARSSRGRGELKNLIRRA
jgi:hypothetical protein